jgi:hypothetical protein
LNLDDGSVDLIRLGSTGEAIDLQVRTRVIGLDGKVLSEATQKVHAAANARTPVAKLVLEQVAAGHTVLVKLEVTDMRGTLVSDNVYWWSADEGSLRELDSLAPVTLTASAHAAAEGQEHKATVQIKNASATPALLVKLTLRDAKSGERILPAYLSDNYFSLLPGEEKTVTVNYPATGAKPEFGVRGWNVVEGKIPVE